MKLFPPYAAAAALILLLHIPPATAATEKVLYSFCSQQYCADGELPYAGVLSVNGELYATANTGGDNGTNEGTLNAVNRKTGAARVVYSFENYYGDPEQPDSDLIDVNGTLYGTTP